jgi:hypothetical protein
MPNCRSQLKLPAKLRADGTRRSSAVTSRSSFWKTTNVTGEIRLPGEIDMVLPGDNASVAVRLGKLVAFDVGSHFAIREGGKTAGSGLPAELGDESCGGGAIRSYILDVLGGAGFSSSAHNERRISVGRSCQFANGFASLAFAAGQFLRRRGQRSLADHGTAAGSQKGNQQLAARQFLLHTNETLIL